MQIDIELDKNVPIPEKGPYPEYRVVLDAAANTANMLAAAGLDFAPTDDDIDTAAATVRTAAKNPGGMKTDTLLSYTPAAVMLTKQILDAYGHKIIEEAEKVRHLVMNKLVQETENKDPKIRIRALELLGKMGDVGLFTERKEVTITHQSSDDVKDRLRARLARLLPQGTGAVPDAEIVEPPALPKASPPPPPAPKTTETVDEPSYKLSLEAKPASASLFE
jgi:hypothetical protein